MLQKSDLEDDIAAYIRDRLPEAEIDVVFDVGANVGWFTYQFLRAYPQCKAFLFEPVTSIFDAIAANLGRFADIKAFPRAKPFRLALGMARGTANITAVPGVTTNRLVENDSVGLPLEPVNLIRGDDFCAEHGISRINFLKIDTEGHDLKALLGFSRMLLTGGIDFVQVEAGFGQKAGVRHVSVETFDRLLAEFGYHRFRINNQCSGQVPVLTWADVVFIQERAANKYVFR